MPKFKITDTQSGQSLVINADRPPEQNEVEEIFLNQKQQAFQYATTVPQAAMGKAQQIIGSGLASQAAMQQEKARQADQPMFTMVEPGVMAPTFRTSEQAQAYREAALSPKIRIPRIQSESLIGQIAAAPVNLGSSFLESATTLPGAALIGAGPIAGRVGQAAMGVGFGAPMAAEGLKKVVGYGAGTENRQAAIEGALAVPAGALMALGGVRGAPEPRPISPLDRPAGAATTITQGELNQALRDVFIEKEIEAQRPAPKPTISQQTLGELVDTIQKRQVSREPASPASPARPSSVSYATPSGRTTITSNKPLPESILASIARQQAQQGAPIDIQAQVVREPSPPTAPPGPVEPPSSPQPSAGPPHLQDIVPAILTMGGEKVIGEQGQVHDDVIKANNLKATDIDRRIFVNKNNPTVEISREQLNQMGVPPTEGGTPGRADADQLAALQEGAPSDTQGQGRLPGGEPPNREELRNLPQQGGGTAPAVTDQPVSQEVVQPPQGAGTGQTAPLVGERAPSSVAQQPKVGLPPQQEKAYQSLPQGDQLAFKDMRLGEETNLGTVVRNLGASRSVLPEHSALARFLDERFGHVLGVQSVDLGRGAADAAYYDPYGQKAYLDVEASDIPLPLKVLEEAAHAATMWQIRFPKNEIEFKAAQVIKNLRIEGARKGLTLKEMAFLTGEFDRLMSQRAKTGQAPQAYWDAFDKAGVLRSRSDFLYRLHNDDEFIGGMFADRRFRNFLNSWDYGDRGGLFSFVDSVKKLLGVGQDKALDTAFDALINVAEARGGIEGRMPEDFAFSPPPQAQAVRDLTHKEWLKQHAAYASGWTLPQHAGVSEDLANAGAALGGARNIMQVWPKAVVTRVLGERQDLNFRRILTALGLQGRLNGRRAQLDGLIASETDPAKIADYQAQRDAVVNVWDVKGSPIRSQEEYERVLNHPENRAALERHIEYLQPLAEAMHVEVGGKLSPTADPETGAFMNLKALMDTEDEAAVRQQLYGGGRGVLSGLRRGSAFGREFKGTGKAYNFDYRFVGERMLKSNYEAAALSHYVEALKDAGMAVERKAGDPPEPPKTAKGKPLVPRDIEVRAAGNRLIRTQLWLHPDLAKEFDGLKRADSPEQTATKALLVDTLNAVQIFGFGDAIWHVKNDLGAIATAQGGGGVLIDLARRIGGPVTSIPDALGRVIYNGIRVIMDTPAVQEEIAKYTLAGAGRSTQVHQSLIGKAAVKLGGREWMDPNFVSGKLINIFDRASRVTLNQMADDLIRRKWIDDTVLNRREIVNKAGQYQSQLMSQFARTLREVGWGPFVVATRNFNRIAAQRLILSPGVRAANPGAWVKMRIVEGVAMAMSFVALPMLVNYLLRGDPHGRKGVKLGQVDLGTDDQYGRPKVWDPQVLTLARRGLTVTGGAAYLSAREQGLSKLDTTFEVSKAVIDALLKPGLGPALRAIATGLSGRDSLTGRPTSLNPFDTGQNLKAAAQQLNPMIASELGTTGSLPGGPRGLLKTAAQAAGFGVGRFPSFKERMDEEVGKLGHQPSVQERVSLTRKIRGEMAETPQEPISRYAGAERRHAHDFSQQDALKERLGVVHQKFLDEHGLTLPGFQEEMTLHRVHVPLDRAEANKMSDIFARRYEKAIAILEADATFKEESHARQQVRLNRVLTRAREQARRESRGLLRPTAQP